MKPRYLLFALLPVVAWLLLGASVPDKVPLYVYRDDGRIAAPTQFLATVFQAGTGVTIVNNRTSIVISATSGSMAVAPGVNTTVATNTVGTTTVFTISASLVGGAASMADVTNVVVSFVTDNATNVFFASANFLTNWANAISNLLVASTGQRQYGSAALTNLSALDAAMVPAGTNLAYAPNLTLYGNRQWRGSVSNALTGNLNLLWTNANTFGGASLVLTADGSARTVYLFFEAARTVRYCTNTVLAETNVVVPANGTVNLLIGNFQTNFVKVGAVKMQ